MGIFAELAKSKRNREDYRNQLRLLSVANIHRATKGVKGRRKK